DGKRGNKVTEWQLSGGRLVGGTLSDGSRQEADLALLGVGIDPNIELAAALGLPIEAGGVAVDPGLKTADGVYCAGDIAVHQRPVLGRAIRVEHWEVAKGQGRGVATSSAPKPTP